MIACDLGSNTIRFVEINCDTKKRVKEYEQIVKALEPYKYKKEIPKMEKNLKDKIKRFINAI